MHEFQLLAVGTDTEVFLRDTVTKKPVPVVGLLGGTKREPLALPYLGEGFSVQEDNVMAEFNIPATNDAMDFIIALEKIKGWLSEYFGNKGLELDIVPSQLFEISQLRTKQAQTFGCEPDYNAWEMCENDIDQSNPLLNKMRTAGGHVHISFTRNGNPPEVSDLLLMAKLLDLFLGVPSVVLDPDVRRRAIYGKAGAFRPKQYSANVSGLEYRTLSNFWIASSHTSNWVFQQVTRVFAYLNHHSVPNAETAIQQYGARIQHAINEPSKDHAFNLISDWNLKMPDNWEGVSKKSMKINSFSVGGFTATPIGIYAGGIDDDPTPTHDDLDDEEDEDQNHA